MTHWLDIIGVTEQGLAALPPGQQALLAAAHTIIGVQRRLDGWQATAGQNLLPWDGKLDEMVARILAARRTPTVLLASGDPNWFGIGATLARHLPAGEFAMHPVPSSFQLAAAHMHWPMQNLETLSLHGRPVSALHPHLLPGNRILALTSDSGTLPEVAALMIRRGYGKSHLTVLENLGAPDARIVEAPAGESAALAVGDFYVLAIDCVADADAPLLPPQPGLPDEAFQSDGQLTKRHVRAVTLASLAPFPGALLWDVGAGCGSVAIEFKRAARGAIAICFERDMARCDLIAANAASLGVQPLQTVPGDALKSLSGQPAPDAVFLGGDVANDALFDACWQALRPGGRMAANAVTLDGVSALFQRQSRFGGELARIEISVLDNIGSERVFRPRMGVTHWSVTKGAAP